MSALRDAAGFVLVVIIEALFVHLAALVVLRQSKVVKALIVASAGTVIGHLAFFLLGERLPVVAFLIVLIAWMGICAGVYRTTWVRALVVGILGYGLYVLSQLLVEYDWSQMFN